MAFPTWPGMATGLYKRITASGNISDGKKCQLTGFFCTASTAGTIQIYDDAATGTGTPVLGTAITMVAGTWYFLPVMLQNGCNVVIGGTADVTMVYLPNG